MISVQGRCIRRPFKRCGTEPLKRSIVVCLQGRVAYRSSVFVGRCALNVLIITDRRRLTGASGDEDLWMVAAPPPRFVLFLCETNSPGSSCLLHHAEWMCGTCLFQVEPWKRLSASPYPWMSNSNPILVTPRTHNSSGHMDPIVSRSPLSTNRVEEQQGGCTPAIVPLHPCRILRNFFLIAA